MSVRVGTTYSDPRPINAGAPQGSVLGSYLFNIGTDDLEDNVQWWGSITDLEYLERPGTMAVSTPVGGGPIVPPAPQWSLVAGEQSQVETLPGVVNGPGWSRGQKEAKFVSRLPSCVKYIDDSLILEKLI